MFSVLFKSRRILLLCLCCNVHLLQIQYTLAHTKSKSHWTECRKSEQSNVQTQGRCVSDFVNLSSHQEEKKTSCMESSGSDYSSTEHGIDLDATTQREEMCCVGTLADKFSLSPFKRMQSHNVFMERTQSLFDTLEVGKVFVINFLQHTWSKWQLFLVQYPSWLTKFKESHVHT